MNHTLQIIFAVIALICGIGDIIFSVVHIPESMVIMVILGLIMIIMGVAMWILAISKKNKGAE